MKLKNIYLLTLAVVLTAGCNKDFLDMNPQDRLSDATYWKTESDFQQALTACYGVMQTAGSNYFSYGLPLWDALTDNGYVQYPDAAYGSTTEMVKGNITPTSLGLIPSIYSGSYTGIARCNNFISHIQNFTGITEAQKNQYIAEARMIRAYFYSYLYRCFGDVPIADKVIDVSNMYLPKSAASNVQKFMMADIDFAIANLQDITYATSKGHWTVGAAKAFKARMLLYDAYDANGNAIAANMQQVISLLGGITGYTLAPDYSDNFKDLKQEACPEIMMSVKYLNPSSSSSADVWYGFYTTLNPLANFISEYEMNDGTPGIPVPYTNRGVIDTANFNNTSLLLRDSRAAKTIFIYKYIINGKSYNTNLTFASFAGISKFMTPELAPYNGGTLSQQDWIIVRYADVLLMLAEAENETNGPTAIAYDAINKIRARSAMPPLTVGLSKDQMRDKIRHERRIELAFEGGRYFDLKRWKNINQVYNNVKDGFVTYDFENKFYKWPLPQSEINKNNGALIQNPDY